jgi:hypothetical protein
MSVYAEYVGTFLALGLLLFLLSRVFGHLGTPKDKDEVVVTTLTPSTPKEPSFQIPWNIVLYLVVACMGVWVAWAFIVPYFSKNPVDVVQYTPNLDQDTVRDWSITSLFPTARWLLGWYLVPFVLAFIQLKLKMKHRTWGPAAATLVFGLLAAHILIHPWDVWMIEAAIFKDPVVHEYKTLITWIVGMLVAWKALGWYFSTQDLGFVRPLPLSVILFFLFLFRACNNLYL